MSPPASSSSADGFLNVLKFLTSLAWIATAVVAFIEYADYSELAEGSIFNEPSAVQISQVADQAIVGVMPFFVGACALLAITIAVALPGRSH